MHNHNAGKSSAYTRSIHQNLKSVTENFQPPKPAPATGALPPRPPVASGRILPLATRHDQITQALHAAGYATLRHGRYSFVIVRSATAQAVNRAA